MKRFKIQSSLVALMIGLCALFFVGILFDSSFKNLQNRLSHALYSQRPASEDLIIVSLDETLLNSDFSAFSGDKKRLFFAEALETILAQNPKAVYLDWEFIGPSDSIDTNELLNLAQSHPSAIDFTQEVLHFLGTVHPYDQALLNLFASNETIYLFKRPGSFIGVDNDVMRYETQLLPYPPFAETAKMGFSIVFSQKTFSHNSDTIYTIPAYFKIGENGPLEKHIDVQLAEVFAGRPSELPLEDGQFYINYVGPPGSFPSYSLTHLLTGTEVPDSLFTNKIVLVGPTSELFKDRVFTPMHSSLPMPGIEVHANAIQTILEEKFLLPQGIWDFLGTMGFALFLSALIFMRAPILYGSALLVLELALFPFYAQFRFDHGVIVNLIVPIFGLVATYLAVLMMRNLTEFAEKRRLKEAFGRYVSPELVKQVGEHPESLHLGGEKREITALFLDIENFTHLSEKLSPQETVALINHTFDALSKVILSQGGMVDKYEGDAIMALFGAPVPSADHALKACETALLLRETMEGLNGEAVLAGLGASDAVDAKTATLNLRIGLASGEAIVGNMGSEHRFDYTAMGDTVNTASRLEGANKFYGTRILVNEGTFTRANDRIFMRQVDTVRLKGKDHALKIYEVLGPIEGTSATGKTVIAEWEKALRAYQKGEWDSAEAGMNKVLENIPQDGPCKTLLERIVKLRAEPVPGWDGVWTLEGK
jgi:class 3 adenylate cyclase/CHASE2 domain-containing sensor protein